MADGAGPALILYWPPLFFLMLPVILAEGWIGMKVLGVKWKDAWRVSLKADLVSTLVGVPMTGIFLLGCSVGLEMAGVGVHWDSSLGKGLGAALFYMGAIAELLYAPEWSFWLGLTFAYASYFLASVWVEFYIARRHFPKASSRRVRRWAWTANMASYILLGIAVAMYSMTIR